MKKTTLLLLIVFYVLCREGFSQSGKNNTQGISGTPGTISFNSKNSPQEPQDGNSTLGTTYSVDKCGLNYVQASRKITNRHSAGGAGSGFPCVLTISGIPATCSNIEKAYVWMVLSFTAADSAAPHITFTNPSAVTHTFVAGNIGTAPDKCWGEINTQVFRIDVTSAITGNGNYVLNSSDLSDNDVDGATLLITYSDVNAAYQGHMIIADGAMSTQNALGNLTYTIGGFSACAASTFCSAFVINSDFQIASHNSTLNGTTLPFTDNFYNYDVTTASSVTAGQSSSAFASTATGAIDCFALAIAGLYYQTTSCTTCPVPLTASTTFTNTSCGQNNGAAAANVSTANYAPYTYSWSPGGQTTQTATGLAPGVYTYTVKDASGCKTTTGTVSIGGSANITVTAAAASPSVCAGQSTLLTGSGAANYTWSANAGSATTATVSVTPAVATIYTVTGTSGGCLNTGTVSVGVKALPNASANTSGTIGCGGSTATVNGSSATPGATYSWSGPGIVAGGSTATATVNIQGVYTVTVTDPATGCANTATTSVTTSTAVPNASATTTGSLTCINNTVTINGNSTTAGVTYSWSGPAGYTSANQSNVVSVAGNYTLSVTDPSSGCNSLIVTTVSTNTAAPGANATTTGSLTCSSSTATVNAGSATSGVTYNWNGPGIISGGNTASATVNASGTYTVTVTDPGNGCTNTATTAVTSNTMVPSASAMGNGTITCANSTATVTANPTTGGVTYNWSGTGIFSGGNTANAIVNMAGMYTVTVTDPNNGCINTATAAITSNTVIPNAGATSTGTLTCTNNSVTLNGNSTTTGATYSWSGPGGFSSGNQSATANTPGNYTLTVTNPANGCTNTASASVTSNTNAPNASATTSGTISCGGGTATVNAGSTAGSVTYSWSGPGIVSGGNTSSATVNVAGTYTVTVTDLSNGCTNTATTSVTTSTAVPDASASASGALTCTNSSAVLNGNSATPGVTYSWSGPGGFSSASQTPTVNTPGNYTLTVTDPGSGCSNMAVAGVSSNTTVPGAGASTNGTITCTNNSASVNASSSTTGATYSWSGPGGFTSANQSASVNTAGAYTVTVTDPANGCTNTATTNVTASASVPNASASSSGTLTCTNNTATINGNSTTGGVTYTWSGPGAFTSSSQSSNVNTAGVYTLTVNDPSSGCSSVATTTITSVVTTPTANAGPDVSIDYGSSITLNASGGVSYTWSPANDLSCINCANPSASPTVTTTYCVRVQDANGCADTACAKVIVDAQCGDIFVPNAFSPNHDGQNDLECVYGNCIRAFHFTVYDRWGEKIFETTDNKKCWDGTYMGEHLNTAVFAYYLEVTLTDGKVINKKGNINLVR